MSEINYGAAKILLIDDEDHLRNGVKRILELEGYNVETAENGTEGIRKGVTGDFDVILIDLKMPDIGGIEVLRELRLQKPYSICYIATAFASYETAVEATKLGAEGYILKPFTSDELIHDINKGIQKRHLILESERLRKEREESLLELAFERSRLKAIINSLADGVIVINKNEEVVYFNPAALRLLNIHTLILKEKIRGKVSAEISGLMNEVAEEKVDSVKPRSIQLEIKPRGELFVEVSCTPVAGFDSMISGMVLVLKDVTQFKQLEQVKSQFVSMVSHELKSPIAATLGFLDIILNPNLNISKEQEEDFLKRSANRLRTLLIMVNDLLDISRIELNSVKREVVRVELASSIKDCIDFLGNDAAQKNIQIKNGIEFDRYFILADKAEVERVFTNIISNGVKYNKAGGELKIAARIDGSYIRLDFADTGIGMQKEEKEKLFSEFFRAKNEFTRGINGTGLGLSIVKKTMAHYNGKILVESEYGHGTTFSLFFPVEEKI